MKRECILIVLLLLGALEVSSGNGGVPERTYPAEKFDLLVNKTDDENETISIQMSDKKIIQIGTRRFTGGADRYSGVKPESVRVYKLNGKPDLLHIEWVDYSQGMGAYQNLFYIICMRDNPEHVLLKSFVHISGSWNVVSGWFGAYTVSYKKDILCVRVEEEINDLEDKKKPLYHMKKEGENTCYISNIVTTLTRVFTINKEGIKLKSTLLEYKVQEGDTLEEIHKGLNVKPEWVLNADLLEKKVSTIQIEIPKEDSEKRYPLINNRKP